jgi:nicotinamide riboside kinase
MKNTLVINLFAGPGAGKSTGAAYIFSKLKMLGIDAELITEYAKDLVWENNLTALQYSTYVFGNQAYRFQKCQGKVDILITDSPILLAAIYGTCKSEHFKPLVVDTFKDFNNRSYFINRVKEFNPNGRIHNEEESIKKSEEIKNLLNTYQIPYKTIQGEQAGYEIIISDILKELGRE